MRDITYEAYRATVVLLALLDTLNTNCQALVKLGRNEYGERTHVMTDLAKRFNKLHNQAERMNKEAADLNFGEKDEDAYIGYYESAAKGMLGAARKMNRDARAVARFYGIPTKEMTATDILHYGTE